MSIPNLPHEELTSPVYEVYTPCGACASYLSVIKHAQCRHYHLNDGSMMWVVMLPYESEEALRERLYRFNLDYDDVIEINL